MSQMLPHSGSDVGRPAAGESPAGLFYADELPPPDPKDPLMAEIDAAANGIFTANKGIVAEYMTDQAAQTACHEVMICFAPKRYTHTPAPSTSTFPPSSLMPLLP